MDRHEFIEIARKALCCNIIYHPETQQLQLFLNVNDKPCNFVYDEQMIKNNDIDTIMNIIDDDLWTFAYRHTGSENIVLKGSDKQ